MKSAEKSSKGKAEQYGDLSRSYFRNDGGGSWRKGVEECVGSLLFNKNLLFYEPFIYMFIV